MTAGRSPGALGTFTPAEQRKLVDVLLGPAVPRLKDELLWRCRQYALLTAKSQAGYALDQRRNHRTARAIERHAKAILRLAGDDIAWGAIVAPARELISIGVRLDGAPRKLGLPVGAVDLARLFLDAEFIHRGKDRREIPRSRTSAFAGVLRIVYRVADPLPIIDEIIAYRQRRPGPSEVRLVEKSRRR